MCVTRLILNQIMTNKESDFHDHPLVMVNQQRPYTCDGCKTEGIGLRYRCERCNYDLHHQCMFSSPKLKFQGNQYRFLEKPLPGPNCTRANYCIDCRNCDACGKNVKGFVYHCSDTGWDLHPRCAKLDCKISIGDVTFWLEKQGPSTCAWCNKRLLKGLLLKLLFLI